MTSTGSRVIGELFGVGEWARQRRAQSRTVRSLDSRVVDVLVEVLTTGHSAASRLIETVYPLMSEDPSRWWWPDEGRQVALHVVDGACRVSRMVTYQLTQEFGQSAPQIWGAGLGRTLLVPSVIVPELRTAQAELLEVAEALGPGLDDWWREVPPALGDIGHQAEGLDLMTSRLARVVEEAGR